MKNPPAAPRLAVRRLIAALTAATVGGVGSLALATPSHAAAPCQLTYSADFWSSPWEPSPQFEVDARIKNTGRVTSSSWVVYISLPPGTTTTMYWGVYPAPELGDGWFIGRSYNMAIAPGGSADFGLLGITTPANVGGTVGTFICGIG